MSYAQPQPPSPPIIVDNFEDEPQYSRDPRFQRLWQPYSYGTTAIEFHAERVESGVGSNWAFELHWQATASSGTGSMGVGVLSPVVPDVGAIDLSGYSRILLSQSYLNNGTCQPQQTFIISFACSTIEAALEGAVPVSSTTTTSTLPFSKLVLAEYPPERTGHPPANPVSTDACLRLIDEIRIQVGLDLPEGGCADGALLIDNVNIRSD